MCVCTDVSYVSESGGRMCVCTQIYMSVCVLACKTNEKGACRCEATYLTLWGTVDE